MNKKSKTTTKTQPKHTNASSGARLRPWSDLEAKKEVFQIIIARIVNTPGLGAKYVKDSKLARKHIKKLIKVPDDVKIIFLPAGDSDKPGGGSVVIELPPNNPSDRAELSLPDKMESFLCTYNPW